MSPRALFVTTVPITLEAFLLPFSDHFRALGWRVDALANGATRNAHLDGHFDERFDIGWSRSPLDPRNIVGTTGRIREFVASGDYDLVHVHTPIAAFVTRFALRRRSGPARPVVIYTAHGFHFYEGQGPLPHAFYRTMEREAARWTDYLVTINAEDFSAAQQLGTIDPSRVRLIPGIGVDTVAFAPAASSLSEREAVREELGIAPDEFMLVMVAELAPVKRHLFALEALARVTDDRVVLVFVGDGPLRSTLATHAEKLGVTGRVRFAGYRRDVVQVLSAGNAAMLVSEREGLARSVLEAMAAARPVIGARTRGISDAIGPAAGWLVDKHDPSDLARAIDEAAGDSAACERKGAAARARVEAEFSLPHIIRDYEELYREALTSRV